MIIGAIMIVAGFGYLTFGDIRELPVVAIFVGGIGIAIVLIVGSREFRRWDSGR